MTHQFRKRRGGYGTEYLRKKNIITIDRKALRTLLKEIELERQINYESLLRFVKAHRKGRNVWDSGANRKDFVNQCRRIGDFDDSLALYRQMLGMKPKKYAWSPYPEEGDAVA